MLRVSFGKVFHVRGSRGRRRALLIRFASPQGKRLLLSSFQGCLSLRSNVSASLSSLGDEAGAGLRARGVLSRSTVLISQCLGSDLCV